MGTLLLRLIPVGVLGMVSFLRTLSSLVALLGSFVHAIDLYPEKLSLDVSFGDTKYTLDLVVNRELFADGWALEEYSEDGSLRRRVTDPAEFMCHYTGTIRGDNTSLAAFTRCGNLEWSGHVHITSQSRVLQLRQEGEQVVAFVAKETGDEIDAGALASVNLEDSPTITKPQGLPSNVQYVNEEGFVSDEYRMNQFGGDSNAEAKSTQAAVNGANQLYAAAKWEHGNSIFNKIKLQQHSPPGWPKHSKPYNKPKDAGDKFREYCKTELIGKYKVTGCSLINGKAGAWHGGIAGESVEQGMCGNSATSNLKVPGPAISPVLFAHEWGHRYGFVHINGAAGKGCVMYPMMQKQVHFCANSIQLWEQHRGKTGACLLGRVRQPLVV